MFSILIAFFIAFNNTTLNKLLHELLIDYPKSDYNAKEDKRPILHQ